MENHKSHDIKKNFPFFSFFFELKYKEKMEKNDKMKRKFYY